MYTSKKKRNKQQKQKIERSLRCPYCGGSVNFVSAKEIYGNTAEKGSYIYVCNNYPQCDSYVNADKKTLKPLGELADGSLRRKRVLAHKSFDRIWKQNIMTRNDSYKWLSEKLNLSTSTRLNKRCHIGMFREYMCNKTIEYSNEIMKNCKKKNQQKPKGVHCQLVEKKTV